MRPRRGLPTLKESRSCKKDREAAKREQRFREHPLYGKIPLIARTYTVATTGKAYTLHEYDLDYAPPMPRGAVSGDARRQNLCFYHSVPKYFYLDERKSCVQCGNDFLFGAHEQKYWYETLQFSGAATAVRCPVCRRKRRSEKSIRMQLASVKAELKRVPDDPVLLLALAETTVRYHRMRGEGKLAEAITAARRAHKLAPRAHEALFWEAFCHIQDKREPKGRELLLRFVECGANSRKQQELLREARQYLSNS